MFPQQTPGQPARQPIPPQPLPQAGRLPEWEAPLAPLPGQYMPMQPVPAPLQPASSRKSLDWAPRILGIIYLVAVYLTIALTFWGVSGNGGQGPTAWPGELLLLTDLIAALVVVNVVKQRCTLRGLASTAMMVKCGLIPFFLVGAVVVMFCFVLVIVPQPVFLFMGPAMAAVFCFLGWVVMIGGAVFSIPAITRAYREGAIARGVEITAIILQFVFIADVVMTIIVYMRSRSPTHCLHVAHNS